MFRDLESVSLVGTQVTKVGVCAIAKRCPLTNLTASLTIDDAKDIIPLCPTLQSFDVDPETPLPADDLAKLLAGNCPNLQYFDATAMNPSSLKLLVTKCPELKSLKVPACAFTASIVNAIVQRGCLTELNLTDTCQFGLIHRIIEDIAQRCPLRYLLLASSEISSATLSVVAKHCPCLEHIAVEAVPNKFSEVDGLSELSDADRAFISLAKQCPRLRSLCVPDGITSEALFQFAKHCSVRLHSLDFPQSASVTDAVLSAFAQRCPCLQALTGNCCDVTDVSIQEVAKNCPELRFLDVSYSSISDEAITAVAVHCPELQFLGIAECHSVTANSLCVVGQRCPLLKVLLIGQDDDESAYSSELPEGCVIVINDEFDEFPEDEDDMFDMFPDNDVDSEKDKLLAHLVRHLQDSNAFFDDGKMFFEELNRGLRHLDDLRPQFDEEM